MQRTYHVVVYPTPSEGWGHGRRPWSHCLLHQQSHCAKHVAVEDGMTTVVKIVNYIRAQPLHRRKFRVLLDEYNNEYGDLLLHSQI